MRTFLIVLVLLIIGGAAAVYYLYTNIDGIVETAIENNGTDATQSNVSVDDVDISIENETGSLNGLRVANPSGFSDENVISLDGIDVAIDSSKSDCSVTGCKLIVIKELTVKNPVINYEMGVSKSNIVAIRENIERYSGGGGSSSSSQPELKFMIERLAITGGEVNVRTKVGKLASSDLPDIVKQNLGVGQGGISGSEVGEILIRELSSGATYAVTEGDLKGLIEGQLSGGIEDAGEKVKRGTSSIFGGDEE